MSCSYHILCVQCGDKLGDWDDNTKRTMAALLAEKDKLAILAATFASIQSLEVEWKTLSFKTIDINFFQNHKGHPLYVVDEYGCPVSD